MYFIFIQLISVFSGADKAIHVETDKDLQPLAVLAPPSPPVDLYLVAPRTLRRVPAVDAVWRALETLAKDLEQDLEF